MRLKPWMWLERAIRGIKEQPVNDGRDEVPVESVTSLVRDDFSIFKSGYAEQKAKGFKPRNGLEPFRLKLPLDWSVDPFSDRNWCFHLHAWRMLDPIWNEFYGSDWKRLGEEIMPWIRDWYRFHVRKKLLARFSWYDMATGLRAQHLALIIQLDREGLMPLTEEDARIVRHLALTHHNRLRRPDFIADYNHGVFQIIGLRLLGVACRHMPEFDGEPEYSGGMLLNLLRGQFDESGVHVENSPAYHKLMLKQFARIRPGLFPHIAVELQAAVRKATEVLPWFTFPDGRIAMLGDSEGLGVQLGRGASGDRSFVDSAGRSVMVRDLGRSGYVTVRTGVEVPRASSDMLIVRGVPVSGTHVHADALSILLFANGRQLLSDSGKFTYQKGGWRDYFVSARAHNTVVPEGRNYGPEVPDTRAVRPLVPKVHRNTVSIRGQVKRSDGFRHERKVVYDPVAGIEVVDRLDNSGDDAIVAYWHLAEGLDAEVEGSSVVILDNGTRIARFDVLDRYASIDLVFGRSLPDAQGWLSPKYGQRTEATVVEVRYRPGTRKIATRVVLVREKSKVDSPRLPRALTHDVGFDFPFRFRRDRAYLLPDGGIQRRVVVRIEKRHEKVARRRLFDALLEKGFVEATRPTQSDGTTRVRYKHPDGTAIVVKLRHASAPTAEGGEEPATLYFAWSAETGNKHQNRSDQ